MTLAHLVGCNIDVSGVSPENFYLKIRRHTVQSCIVASKQLGHNYLREQ